MRERRAFISFPTEKGFGAGLLKNQKVLDGLNIGFDVTIHADNGVPADGSIDIYNLNREDMEFLSTSAATWMTDRSLIQLYAGYEDNVKLIYGGAIVRAPTQGYPDTTLHVSCLTGLEWMTTNIDVRKSNIKMMDLVDYVSSVTGYPINIPGSVRRSNEMLNKTIKNFSFSGSVHNLVDKVQRMLGGFSLDGKSVLLSVYNDNTFVWNPAVTTGGDILSINDQSGMIGIPELTDFGISVKMLLNPDVHAGDIVHIESRRVPRATGDYFVTEIHHHGELRSTQWYTTLRCTYIGGVIGGSNDKAI